MGYTLGIDIGIASIGFAGIDAGVKKMCFQPGFIFLKLPRIPKMVHLWQHPAVKKGGFAVLYTAGSNAKINFANHSFDMGLAPLLQ